MYDCGAVAKRLCTGLQIRVGRFDSGSRLQDSAGVAQLVERNLAKVEVASSRLVSRSSQRRESLSAFPFLLLGVVIIAVPARMVKLVDTRDLKSLDRKVVPVRSRFRAPPLTCRSGLHSRKPVRIASHDRH